MKTILTLFLVGLCVTARATQLIKYLIHILVTMLHAKPGYICLTNLPIMGKIPLPNSDSLEVKLARAAAVEKQQSCKDYATNKQTCKTENGYFMYRDNVHPTLYAHKVIGKFVQENL